jgi:hypothetical protein
VLDNVAHNRAPLAGLDPQMWRTLPKPTDRLAGQTVESVIKHKMEDGLDQILERGYARQAGETACY